ncbi:MAG: hypothetical protein JRE62_09060 [Deltaproteobacteria bacterium]|jgi:hypothetical protein|nr:hypothetical protein [Deltaproteobacteria bacterium]
MKRVIKSGSFLMIIALCMVPASGQAFNPLAHIYIAEHACPHCGPKVDYYYGSIAPDIALYVADPAAWPTSFEDTHEDEDYIDLRVFAWGSTQMAFARGWLTHGQNLGFPGADYFAHIMYTRSSDSDPSAPGYVIEKAVELSGAHPEISDVNFAHYVIEATIDLLLKGEDSTLPGKLFFANLFRSWQDRSLLMRVYVWRWWQRRTDWLTLATAELTFRQLVNRYAMALMMPAPLDAQALAELGAELASELFGLDGITAEMILDELLPAAIDLCQDDYQIPIMEAISELSMRLP